MLDNCSIYVFNECSHLLEELRGCLKAETFVGSHLSLFTQLVELWCCKRFALKDWRSICSKGQLALLALMLNNKTNCFTNLSFLHFLLTHGHSVNLLKNCCCLHWCSFLALNTTIFTDQNDTKIFSLNPKTISQICNRRLIY